MQKRLDNAQGITKLALHRQLLDWRDHHLLNVEQRLEEKLPILFELMEKKYEEISLKELFFKRKEFVQREIDPLLETWARDEGQAILNDAKKDLSRILSGILQLKLEEPLEPGCPAHEAPLLDVSLSLAGLVSGAAALSAISALAIGSVGIGFLSISIVSWPALIGGVTMAAAFGSGGIYKAATLKKTALKKHLEKTKAFVRKLVLCSDESKGESLCRKLQDAIWKAYRELDAEIAP